MEKFDLPIKKSLFSIEKVSYLAKLTENLPRIDQKLDDFKISCLLKASHLYIDNFIEINEKHELIKRNGKIYLKILVSFNNKGVDTMRNSSLEFYSENGVSIWIKPKKMPDFLTPKQIFIQEIVINYLEIPYSLLLMDFSYESVENKKFIIK